MQICCVFYFQVWWCITL